MENRRYVTIALISMTLLGLEMIWTRIFSAEFFYTFAFLTLSLAVMGLGLGALALRLLPRLNNDALLGGILTLGGLMSLLGPPAVIWIGLGILTYLLGWAMMEPWTYFIGLGATLGSYAYFAVTHREASPKTIYDRIVESKKSQNYQAAGFDLPKYERLIK